RFYKFNIICQREIIATTVKEPPYILSSNPQIVYRDFIFEYLIARPDWFINGELPIKTETKIAAILNNAHKRPSERTQ
ncbi:hypothetical protein ACSLPA_33480, partial [Escherichia coli]